MAQRKLGLSRVVEGKTYFDVVMRSDNLLPEHRVILDEVVCMSTAMNVLWLEYIHMII